MVNLSRKQLLIIGSIVIVIAVIAALVATGGRESGGGQGGQKVNIVFWGVDAPEVWEGIIKEYSEFRPQANVRYVAKDASNYRESVLNALAAGSGPDIFYVGNRDIPMEANKIAAADPRQIDTFRLRELYPKVVEQDFVLDGRVAALPLYLDTMVMIYNRDIFDQAGVAVPPKTWEEFLKILPELREFGAGGQIVRAAAAIGGSEKSVDAGVDLLNLLMLQNGAEMTNSEKTKVTFASGDSAGKGFRAFDFYLQFANATSPYFTWMDSWQNSIDAFAQGKVAVIFNYLSSIKRIKSLSPFLDIGIAPMLQTSAGSSVNYARYEGLAVARQSRVRQWAWDFVIFAATRESAAKTYASLAGRLPALRSLLAKESGDVLRSVFAKQALTARSWTMPSSIETQKIMSRAIENALSGQVSSAAALRQAEGQINQLYPRQ